MVTSCIYDRDGDPYGYHRWERGIEKRGKRRRGSEGEYGIKWEWVVREGPPMINHTRGDREGEYRCRHKREKAPQNGSAVLVQETVKRDKKQIYQGNNKALSKSKGKQCFHFSMDKGPIHSVFDFSQEQSQGFPHFGNSLFDSCNKL